MTTKPQHGGRRQGAGRKPAPQAQRLIAKTLRMTEQEWLTVKALADLEGVSVNEYIRKRVR